MKHAMIQQMQGTYLLSLGYCLTGLCLGDLAEVMRIEHSASDFPWRAGHFEDSLRNGCAGVCIRHVEGALCGYCIWMPVVDEVHLLNLCVAPSAQKKRLGLALLKHAALRAQAAGGTRMLLEVGVSSRRALHLYRRFGFIEIGIRKNYYVAAEGTREDAYVMRLILSEVQYAAS